MLKARSRWAGVIRRRSGTPAHRALAILWSRAVSLTRISVAYQRGLLVLVSCFLFFAQGDAALAIQFR